MPALSPSFTQFQDELQEFDLAKFSQILKTIGWQDSLQTHNISKQQQFCHGRIMARRLQTNISYIIYDVFNNLEFNTTDILPPGCFINMYTGDKTVSTSYDQQQKPITFSNNQCTILYSTTPTNTETIHPKNTSLTGLTILIDDSVDSEVSKQVRSRLPPNKLTISQQAIPTTLRTSLQELLNMPWQPQLTRLYSDGLILQSIAKLLHTPHNESGLPAAQLKQLQQVRAILQQKPAEKHSIVELAQRVGMSPSVLQRKFKQYFGITLFQYLKNIRMDAAALLLEQGYSVQEAAYCVGYSYPENFSAAFKDHFGYSPKIRN